MGILFFCDEKILQSNLRMSLETTLTTTEEKKKCPEKKKIAETEREFFFSQV